MDPLSLVVSLTEVLGLCAVAIEELKKFWNAGRDLRTLISRVGRAQRTIESILEVVREMKAAGFASLEFSLDSFVNPLKHVIRQILQQIKAFVSAEPGKLRPKFVQKLLWTLSRDKLGYLEKEMKDLEAGMANQVSALNLLATMKHLGIVRSNTLAVTSPAESELHDAFSDTATLAGSFVENPDGGEKDVVQIMRTWLGNLDTSKHDQEYVQLRARLSEAAKYGNWHDFFDLLEIGRRVYGESWVNAPRTKRREELQLISLWTPLHQAVYMGAPVDAVLRLLELGASKTLRTRWTEFPWPDMTPLELALHLGATSLLAEQGLLRPTIQQPVPHDTLKVLQDQFHELIKHDMNGKGGFRDEEWWLPELEMLLELEPRQWIWFPTEFSQAPRTEGYWYCLDGRDLLVRSENTTVNGNWEGYRITVAGTFEVEQAVMS
ncbi:hypothetical protein QBC37DRAFT_393608 [Rhypophila decipiens]|uniref:Uncharacterized protein n=1 Tax=Rhypophila decipiens TaxID=261697 RepID=A0AAN6XT94_9PEZI|nr:hypothetical protein QBC37DRAFT_393608 [Rhypophila decipiens]